MSDLSERLANLEAQAEDARRKLEASELERDTTVRRSAATDALRARGVTNIKAALAILDAQERRLAVEDGAPVYLRDPHGAWNGAVAMEVGISEWLAGPDGAHFLPVKGSRGGGDTGRPDAVRHDGTLDTRVMAGKLTEAILKANI